ncbi:hypothetical protein [Streptomyces decoyicus]|uniref:hypothetical protein n=1 Tax=Streptomyces decoyicus TaxID=249567 RepID=UPI0033BF12ED
MTDQQQWIPDRFDPDSPPPELDHRLAHCPAGRLPLGSGPVERCIEIGPHERHRNAAGDTWTDEPTED